MQSYRLSRASIASCSILISCLIAQTSFAHEYEALIKAKNIPTLNAPSQPSSPLSRIMPMHWSQKQN
jgi:hypothetical protein